MQKGQVSIMHTASEAVCIMYGLAMMATNSGTHDADYKTNIRRSQGMCAACLHLSTWHMHAALHINVTICHHGMHVISTCLIKLIANCLKHMEFGVTS